MTFLDIHTSSAWGVNAEEPVVIQLHLLSGNQYLDGPEPHIEVYQSLPNSKEKRKFGLGVQIQKLVKIVPCGRYMNINYNLELLKHLSQNNGESYPTIN